MIVLWLLIVCGFACHSIMDLLPLFWGKSIAISADGSVPQGMLVFMAVLSLLVPSCGLFCMMFERRWTLIVNAVLASFVGLFNLVHAFMELPGDNAAQFVIMPLMIIIGGLLAWQSIELVRKA